MIDQGRASRAAIKVIAAIEGGINFRDGKMRIVHSPCFCRAKRAGWLALIIGLLICMFQIKVRKSILFAALKHAPTHTHTHTHTREIL